MMLSFRPVRKRWSMMPSATAAEVHRLDLGQAQGDHPEHV
jgi:hypothetical protein